MIPLVRVAFPFVTCVVIALGCATIPDFKVTASLADAGVSDSATREGGGQPDSGTPRHYLFVSETHAADFGVGQPDPQTAASVFCTNEAEVAIPPRLKGRRWRALISWTTPGDAGDTPQGGLGSIKAVAGGWYTLDDTFFLSTLESPPANLPSGGLVTFANGTKVPNLADSNVWSGAGGYDCDDWTTRSSSTNANVGNAFLSSFNGWWGELGQATTVLCDTSARFLCFEQEP